MDCPYSFQIAPNGHAENASRKLVRTLSSLKGQFADSEAYTAMLSANDRVLYEVYEFDRPHVAGEVLHGVSVVHSGKVGGEYFMTKGHFHDVLETGEMYYCLSGEGRMVMETPEGDWAVEAMRAGSVTYVPPRWAHRSVNTGSSDLVMLFAYPGNSGHDYGTIEHQGFRKRVVEGDGGPQLVDNAKWLAPARRS